MPFLNSMDDEHYPYILYYVPSLNRFLDVDWIVVHNLHVMFDTWQLDVWKNKQQDEVLVTKDGFEILLRYMNPEEEDDVYDFLSFQECFGFPTDRKFY